MIQRSFSVFADYNQFYVWDAGTSPAAPKEYTDDDVRRMVKLGPNVIVIQTVRAVEVPVELELHPSDPGCDRATWDHVVECGIDIPTGQLQVHECTGGPVLDVAVQPSLYSARILFRGLDSISDDGLDGHDKYKVVLWPERRPDLFVVKQWSG